MEPLQLLREGVSMTATDAGVAPEVPDARPVVRPARRWRRAVGIAVLMVLVFAAGYATHSIRRLWAAPDDSSVEAGFARDMSAHHAQAVSMSMVAWQRAARPATRSMAYATVTAQQQEIGVMQTWLDGWHLSATGSRAPMAWMIGGAQMLTADGRMPGMASRDELDRLDGARGEQVDVLFCQLMIRHHVGGLHMIDAVLAGSRRPEVRELAAKMRDNQRVEVVNLEHMLADLGAAR